MSIKEHITKRTILSKISQEDIFFYYLRRKVKEGFLFRSPFRKDQNPTCSFKFCNDNVWRFRDWSESKTMDCFDIVMRIYNLNFNDALNRIYNDLQLSDIKPGSILPLSYILPGQELKEKKSTKQADIKVRRKNFSKQDIKYLKSYRINKDLCTLYNVYSIDYVEINGISYYYNDDSDPALGYFFGIKDDIQLWKIYFYKRYKKKNKPRFIMNNKKIQGYNQLPEKGKFLIITKSMKDVMTLRSFGVNAIAPPSENYIFSKEFIKQLKKRFNYIKILYDFDYAGVVNTNKIRKEHNLDYYFINRKSGAKDISDYYKQYGDVKTFELITNILINI